ncbi:MAG TPA: HDOD domain-containing protein [Nitrospirae bacterium]|nr:HDOD domain-containing protein [Nitrospirota bacterium]
MIVNDSLKFYVRKITKLPTLPVIAQEILAIIDDDLIPVNKLEKIIENDPAISAKIVSVANSAFFGFRTPAGTLNNAIMRIGFKNVKNIALAISLMTVLENGKYKSALDYRRVFNHSVSVGFIAKLISAELIPAISEELLINGMLHDIGFLALSRFFPDAYLNVLNEFDKDGTLLEAEKKILSFTHADIGNWLAEKWNLPETVLNTTLHHHTPSLAKNNLQHLAIVHIADYITTRSILSATGKDPYYPFDSSCLDMLGMSDNDFADIEARVKDGSLLSGLFKL